jgi:integrase
VYRSNRAPSTLGSAEIPAYLGELLASSTPVAFFTREQATLTIAEAKEPFKTLFACAWLTGLRAGELLALTLDDLNFDRKTIRVNKSSDDLTREIRQPKTKCSVALLPMPSALETVLRNYIKTWTPKPSACYSRHDAD